MERFQILKAKTFNGLYAVLDNEEQMIVATADTVREARKVVNDLNLLINQDRAVDEAMSKLFG